MAHQYGDNYDHRRKAQRVFVDPATGDAILRLHQTDIVRVTPTGDVTLSTGGWPTHKTIHSMNDALELFDMAVAPNGNIPNGRWSVMDSHGIIHPYNSTPENYTITVKARGSWEDTQRARRLAEAYNVPWRLPTPPVAPRTVAAATSRGPRTVPAAAAPRPQAPPTAAQTPAAATAPRANGTAPAASTTARPGGTWATVARASVTPQANTGSGPSGIHSGAHPVRMTGPGAAAAAAGPSRAAGFSGNASGNSSAQPPTATAARPQAPAGHSAPPPPPAGGQAGGPQPPPLPVGAQLVQQMERLGIDQQELENDAHLCVVCMEEPRSIVLVPCGHMALCKDCCELIIVQQQQQCPMCCQDVEYHVEVDQ